MYSTLDSTVYIIVDSNFVKITSGLEFINCIRSVQKRNDIKMILSKMGEKRVKSL